MKTRLPKGFVQPVAIGQGQFGKVYRARDLELGRYVALKKMPLAHRELAEKEARDLAALSAPCLPVIFGIRVAHGSIFVIEEWIPGVSLRSLLQQDVPLPVREQLAWDVIKAANTLHSHGIVHGDIKPDNVLCPKDGQEMRWIDFGMMGGVKGGSPGYMAPEIAGAGEAGTKACDVWAVGVMVFEILTGNRPSAQDQKDGWQRLRQIGAQDDWPKIVQAALCEDPKQRCDLSNLMELCQGLAIPDPTILWIRNELLQRSFAREIATRLEHTARQIHRQRPQEAFGLLSEALEWDPDHTGALELLPKIGQGQHSRMALWIGLLSIAVTTSILGILWVTLRPQSSTGAKISDPVATLLLERNKEQILPTMEKPRVLSADSLPWKQDSRVELSLSQVAFLGFSPGTLIQLGKTEIVIPDSGSIIIAVPIGRHVLRVWNQQRLEREELLECTGYRTLQIHPVSTK